MSHQPPNNGWKPQNTRKRLSETSFPHGFQHSSLDNMHKRHKPNAATFQSQDKHHLQINNSRPIYQDSATGIERPPDVRLKIPAPSPLPPLPTILPGLESEVFTHESAVNGTRHTRTSCYDRLEILGDAYLEILSCRHLYTRYLTWTAGRISQQREIMVRNETLAAYAQAYGFDARLLVDKGVREKAGRESKEWVKMMGDMFEAYAAAVVLSHGAEGETILEGWLLQLWEGLLPGLESKSFDEQAKTKLAQKVCSRGVKLRYQDYRKPVQVKGEGHITYYIEVRLTGWNYKDEFLGQAEGNSMHEAGQKAASNALSTDLVKELAQTKKVYDAKVKQEREDEAMQKGAQESGEGAGQNHV